MKIFNTVAKMRLAKLTTGQKVKTNGYTVAGDLGAAEYMIDNGTVDGFADHLLANGTRAKILLTGVGNVQQFGGVEGGDLSDAILAASTRVRELNFEGITSATIETSVVLGTACTKWSMVGATITVKTSLLTFAAPSMEIDLGNGYLKGGNKLGKVAVESGILGNTLILEDASEFSVGDPIACSLDNGYLPNSANRTGYIEHGDFNRVISIAGNVLTLSYNFLRSDLYTVDTGIVAGAWVGTNNFSLGGLHFTGKGSPVIKNGKIGRFSGYTIKVEDGTPDGQSVDPRTTQMLMQNILLEDTTLDIIWFRGLGITFDNVRCTQQKDFGKQFGIVSTPYDTGYVKYINGCNIARMNRDGEILPYHFGDQAETECGLVSLDGTNVFSGEHDPAITVAADGEVQFLGARVPYSDSILAFHLFDTTAASWKGFHSRGDRFLKYMWGIFATTSSPPTSFRWDTIIFEGSYTECDPVFIKNPNTVQDRVKNDFAHFIGGEYHTRVNFQVNQGVVTISEGAKWVCPFETTQIPATPTVLLKDFKATGGSMEGGWRVNSNTCMFDGVVLAYANSTIANPPKSLLLTAPLSTTLDNINFILEDPAIYEATGLPLKEFDGVLDLGRWLGFNQSDLGIGANIKFRMYSHPAEFYTASEDGFSKLYSAIFTRPTLNSGMFAQPGAWAKPVVGDFVKTTTAPNSLGIQRIGKEFGTTMLAAEALGTVTITLATTPVGDEDLIGIYDTTSNTWFWYVISNIVGDDVTLGNSASASVGLVKAALIGDTVQMIKLDVALGDLSASPLATKVQITSNKATPFDDPLVISFDESAFDELSAFNLSFPKRLTVPLGVSRVDVSGYVQYATLSLPVDTAFSMRISHLNSGGTVLEVVAATTQRTGFLSHRCSVSALSTSVNVGDYFELEIEEASFVADIAKARLTMVGVK